MHYHHAVGGYPYVNLNDVMNLLLKDGYNRFWMRRDFKQEQIQNTQLTIRIVYLKLKVMIAI
jgi:hypothetical protein